MPVAICFVIPHRKKAQEYFVVFFECFETSKHTIDFMHNRISVYYSDWSKLIRYYLATKVFRVRLELFAKLGIYLFDQNYSIFWSEKCIQFENCDLDVSVEWFELLFRNIKLTVVGVAHINEA